MTIDRQDQYWRAAATGDEAAQLRAVVKKLDAVAGGLALTALNLADARETLDAAIRLVDSSRLMVQGAISPEDQP